MKTLPALILFCSLTALAQIPPGPLYWLEAAANPKAASGGVIYLINQNFEGAAPGWPNSGAVTFNSTASPLAGTQSLLLDDTGGPAYTAPGWSDAGSDIWCEFLFRANTLPSPYSTVFFLRDSAYNYVLELRVLSAGTLELQDYGGFVNVSSSVNVSSGTVYYVWVHYKAGSSANAVLEVWWSTSSTNPGSGGNYYISATNGAGTLDATSAFFILGDGGSGQNWTADFDNVLISATKFW